MTKNIHDRNQILLQVFLLWMTIVNITHLRFQLIPFNRESDLRPWKVLMKEMINEIHHRFLVCSFDWTCESLFCFDIFSSAIKRQEYIFLRSPNITLKARVENLLKVWNQINFKYLSKKLFFTFVSYNSIADEMI